jgi:hypothetical protein
LEILAQAVQTHDPLPLIVRVAFAGPTSAHDEIAGDLAYWKEAVRSAAMSQFGERVWIERVTIHTSRPEQTGTPSLDPGPLRELKHVMAEIQADEALLASLGGELSGLFRKLPAEYRRGSQAIDPANPSHLRQIVEQAQALLIRGLKKEGDGA